MLTKTAPVGQAVLRNAICLKQNHIIYKDEKVFDPVATGCDRCSMRGQSNLCADCLLKIYKTEKKKVYVNEKSRYGEKQRLNRNAILLFLWLHFDNPDENGFIKRVDVVDVAEMLKCHPRTVVNNLHELSEYGYIAISKLPVPGYYAIHLSDYRDYFKQAKNGGRGYVTVSYEMFTRLCEQRSINALRLAVRGILTSTEQMIRNGLVEDRTYKDVKNELPAYVTKREIRDIIHSEPFQMLFTVSAKKKYTFSYQLKPAYTNNVRDALVEDCKKAVLSYIHTINENNKKNFLLKDEDVKNIADIGAKYPLPFIIKAVETVYKTYVCKTLPIQDVGALVRTITKSLILEQEFLESA